MTKQRVRALTLLAAFAVVFGAGLYSGLSERATRAATGTTTPQTLTINLANPQGQTPVDMSQFWAAWNILNDNFVQTHASTTIPTDQKKLYGAIAGLVASYGDPYTVFFPPVEAQIFNDDVGGSFGGVGMEIDNDSKGELIVVSPLKGSPAEAAGIQTGDLVVAVDGTSTLNMASNEAVKIIRGPKGSTVHLTILHKGADKTVEIPIVRDTINIPIINTKQDINTGIFTIELYSFSANSANLFRDALREFVLSGDHKLIIDLRGNPGGYLDAAVNIASYFLPVGQPIVTEDYKGKQNNVYHRSYGFNLFANDPLFKVAILADQGSASASEILSAALVQNGVGKLVGTRTFGKGSVQELIDLGGGAELKVTVARWLTPNGSSITDSGVQPDIKAERTIDDRKAGLDPQRDAAVKYLTGF